MFTRYFFSPCCCCCFVVVGCPLGMSYYAQPHPAFLYVLLVHCLIVCTCWTIGISKLSLVAGPQLRVTPACLHRSTPDASISLKTFEQIAPLSAAKETSRVVWRSISSRHGRCILPFASVHANALRSAQPEGNPGTDGASSPNSLFSPLLCPFIQSFFLVIFR